MARYRFQSTFVDGLGRVVSGGQVTVYKAGTTTLATIYSTETTGTAVSGSVLTTDSTGFFSFWVDDEDYSKSQRFDIVLSKTGFDTRTHSDVIIIGGFEYDYYPDFNESDQGVTGNGRTIKAYIDNAGSDSKTICLRPGTYTIATAITIPSNISIVVVNGGLLTKSGSGAITINGSIKAGLYQIFSGFASNNITFGKSSISMFYPQFVGVKGDDTTDDTTAMQLAIDIASGNSLGYLYCPKGTYKCNVTIKSNVIIRGEGMNTTIFKPVTDAPVFKTSTTDNAIRIGWKDCLITGDITKVSQDGILLKSVAVGTRVNIITIDNVRIDNCGRYGLRAEGEVDTGPFVQNLRISNSTFTDCVNSGLSLYGAVLETTVTGTFVTKNGGSAGTNNNCEVRYNATGGGSTPTRVGFYGCGFNHAQAASVGNPGIAVYIHHAKQVSFDTCDIENANPFLKFEGTLQRNSVVRNCNLSGNYNCASIIEIAQGNGLRIENNNFSIASGTATVGILGSNATSSYKNLTITDDNVFGGNVTTPISVSNNVTIATGKIYAYRGLLRVNTEASAASDDLDYIYDDTGTDVTTNLVEGQRIIIQQLNDARNITIKNATGNILLKGGNDWTMSDTGCVLELAWNGSLSSWVEVGRRDSLTQTYSATNVVTDRAYNANATSVDELADVLGTLIADLRSQGIVK